MLFEMFYQQFYLLDKRNKPKFFLSEMNIIFAIICCVTKCQFHQRSTYSFYARGAQKCKRETLLGTLHVKAVIITLMKLSPSVTSLMNDPLWTNRAQWPACLTSVCADLGLQKPDELSQIMLKTLKSQFHQCFSRAFFMQKCFLSPKRD